MKILITGGTGLIGQALIDSLIEKGHTINLLTRDPISAKKKFPNKDLNIFKWENALIEPPVECTYGISGVINLMGENIGGKKWSKEQKKILVSSRVDATLNLVKCLEKNLQTNLDFFISASAIGIYPVNHKEIFTEESKLGDTFLATLCKNWENAANTLTKVNRKVFVRTGVVLDKNGGALKKMLPPFMLGLGGPIGNGNQMMSWIHLKDLVNLYCEAAVNQLYMGPINGVAPTPVNNFDFTKALGDAIKRPTLLPVPVTPLKLILGEMSTIVLDSQAVTSKKLAELKFEFQFETIDKALNSIFGI